MCHPKSKRCKCYEFKEITPLTGSVHVLDKDKPMRQDIILKPHEMLELIQDVKDGKWDEYHKKWMERLIRNTENA